MNIEILLKNIYLDAPFSLSQRDRTKKCIFHGVYEYKQGYTKTGTIRILNREKVIIRIPLIIRRIRRWSFSRFLATNSTQECTEHNRINESLKQRTNIHCFFFWLDRGIDRDIYVNSVKIIFFFALSRVETFTDHQLQDLEGKKKRSLYS